MGPLVEVSLEAERHRLGRELHTGGGQSLAVIHFLFFFLMIRRPPRSTPSLHDALPIYSCRNLICLLLYCFGELAVEGPTRRLKNIIDRKSTRLNSSHLVISYAVFC